MGEASQTIVITGAGSGVGRATARQFLEQGWNVVLAGRTTASLEITADNNPNALVVPTDVSDAAAVKNLFARAVERFGTVDVLFNNAGTFGPTVTVDELTPEAWDEICGANLTGAINCAREAFAHYRTTGGGRIINNGSISAQVPRVKSTAYTVTKHAIAGLTKTIELDGREFNIRASQLDIGNAASKLLESFSASESIENEDAAYKSVKGALQPNGQYLEEPTFPVAEAAGAVWYIANLPLGVSINQLTITAGGMPYIGRG